MAEHQEDDIRGQDPTRLCPTCRMPISILAIRCRFCGAEVGRPRKEQETFTVKDLGGEQQTSYTLSGNVTEALEAFMMEEKAQIEAKERERLASQRSLFGRSRTAVSEPAPQQQNGPNDLPALDADRMELSNSTLSASRSRNTTFQQPSPLEGIVKKVALAVGVLVGLAALLIIGDHVWSRMRPHDTASAEDAFVYPNRAEAMLEEGVPVLDAHEEALTALRHNNTQKNRDIAERTRQLFISEIRAQAFSKVYNPQQLNAASHAVTRMAQRDADTRITLLMEEINREVSFHKFILTQVDSETGEAAFRLNNPLVAEREETVAEGDLLQGRFLVTRISDRSVHLQDTSPDCAGRILIARHMLTVAAE